MVFDILIFIAGVTVASLALRDVFETVVVPSTNRSSLRIAHRLINILLPVWKMGRGRRRGLSGTFAPAILVASFIIWMSLLAVGFGLMIYGAHSYFAPPPYNVPEAIYQAGAVIITLGLNESRALGLGRWIVIAAGFCGLGVMTLAVTYLLAVQSNLAARDTGIIKLNTAAGDPPSALTLLETLAQVDDRQEVAEILREGRNWCAMLRQSHSAHPSLIYFQTAGTGAGWPASLGMLLDLALIETVCIDDARLSGPAALLLAEATRLADHVCSSIGLSAEIPPCIAKDFQTVTARLAEAGYSLRRDLDLAALAERRAQFQAPVEAIAAHLGKPGAPLIPAGT